MFDGIPGDIFTFQIPRFEKFFVEYVQQSVYFIFLPTRIFHFIMSDQAVGKPLLDHDDNPFSVDEIEPRLFLGNATAARNLAFLKTNRISHILTIDSFPIPNYVCSSASVTNKYIHIADMSRENILEHFMEGIGFIEDALKDEAAANGVLVHCFYGVSRSATIVIAFLMKKHSISYQRAFER